MNLTAIAVFAGALAPIMPAGLLLLLVALFAIALVSFFRARPRAASGTFVGRHRTRDISFMAQSPIGFIGRITRSTPLPRIVPMMQDGTSPVTNFGLAVLATSTNTARSVAAGDSALTAIFGVAVGNFPFQGTNYSAEGLAPLTPAPSGVLDVLKTGFITVYCNSAQAPSASMTSPVYVWVAASSGTHVQGGFETASSTTNTILISNAYFVGPGDSTGAIELAFNL